MATVHPPAIRTPEASPQPQPEVAGVPPTPSGPASEQERPDLTWGERFAVALWGGCAVLIVCLMLGDLLRGLFLR
jgi:hypothetical protein